MTIAALGILSMLASCGNEKALDSGENEAPPPVDSKDTSSPQTTGKEEQDAGPSDTQKKITTKTKQVIDAGAEEDDAGAQPDEPKKPAKNDTDKTDSTKKKEPDTNKEPDTKTTMSQPEEPKQPDANECTREKLVQKADVYLKTLASGDTMALRIHPSFRYTENGQDVPLGAGAWLRQAQSQFSRVVVDETLCSTLTQAVMDGLTGRFAFGVRLRYTNGLLLEAEAQFVPELLAATDLDAVIPMGDDTFIADVPQDKRMSRDQLFDLAHRYFDSVTGISTLPPSAPECRRLQNGLPLGNGTCTETPGNMRFQQQRYDLADEPNGIVTATVVYNDHIGFYLLKMFDNQLQNIIVIGGAASNSTGW